MYCELSMSFFLLCRMQSSVLPKGRMAAFADGEFRRNLRALLSETGLHWAVAPAGGFILALDSLAPWTTCSPMSLVNAVCSQHTNYFIPSLPISLVLCSHAF